jgi:hypothetical protein
MRRLIIFLFSSLFFGQTFAQLPRPMASPQARVDQKVGLTDLKVEYYRPSKNGRVVFGNVVPYNEWWRTGANENTKFTCSDALLFGTDTLPAGTYAIFTKPTATNWEVVFYADYSNWGTPDEWDEKKVVLRQQVPVQSMKDTLETFTVSFDRITTKNAHLSFRWENTLVALPFSVPTAFKMQANIDKMMNGPSANDYFASAEFYFKEKKDMNQALEWINKAVEIRTDAYWMLRLKAQIQAEMGDFKGAVATAKVSMEAAQKAENDAYVQMNKESIEQWSKMKK